jgi:hypothetical protein
MPFGETFYRRKPGSKLEDGLASASPNFGLKARIPTENLRRDRPPLPREPEYPGHAPDKSAKFCAKCGGRQNRIAIVVGPMTEEDCDRLGVIKRGPKRSDHWFCRFIIWRSLFAQPVDRCSPWFIIRIKTECKKCDKIHHEDKEYARQFSKFRRMLIHGQRMIVEFFPRFHFFSVE